MEWRLVTASLPLGQLSDKIEFMSVVDRGTSILVNT
jgi:hypothetical protein